MAEVVCGIYRIRNVISGRFYVGSSENIYRRFEAHRRKLRAGTHTNRGLQASWNKHGEDAFRFDIISKVPAADLRDVERRLLVPLLSHELCCNMHDETYVFPRTGRTHSDEAKAKISAKVQAALTAGRGGKFIPSEETRAKMSAALKGNKSALGYKRTDEERATIAARMQGNQNWLGKAHSDESKDKMGRGVVAIAPDGTETAYATITKLRSALGLTPPTVHRGLLSNEPLSKGKYRGWRFRYMVNEG